jgi:hypothetical protein
VQEPQLRNDEEQEDDTGTPGIQEVLPPLPLAPRAQGNEVNDERGTMNDELTDFSSSFIVPTSSFRVGV